MRIYTRTGDAGETGLIGGQRVAKASLRIAAVGDVDELNATLGVARTHLVDSPLLQVVDRVQHRLFDLGAELAAPSTGFDSVDGLDIEQLERSIDELGARLPPLKEFILPGGSPAAASLHVSRCVCRRAERTVLALHAEEPLRDEVLAFLNRLSDWLFTAARTANHDLGLPDVVWRKKTL